MKMIYRSHDAEINTQDDNTLVISCSSENPITRNFNFDGHKYTDIRILQHSIENVDLSRFKNKAPVLFQHKQEAPIGVVEDCWLENRKLFAKVKISQSEEAQKIYQQIKEGVLNKTSIGAIADDSDVKTERADNTYTETTTIKRWTPIEVSIVTVPADDSVGIEKRSLQIQQNFTQANYSEKSNSSQNFNQQKEDNMPKPIQQSNEITKATVVTDSYDETRSLILQKAKEYNVADLGLDMIAEKRSYEEFADALLKRKEESSTIISDFTDVDLSPKEQRSYSIARGIQQTLSGERSGLEHEISQTIARSSGFVKDGFHVPQSILTRAEDFNSTTNSANLIKTHHMGIIEKMQAKSAILQSAQMITGCSGILEFARETGNVKAYWTAEGAKTTVSKKSWDEKLELKPRALRASTSYTDNLIAQEAFNIEMMIRNDLAKQFALAVDSAALYGDGKNNSPVGLASTKGIGLYEYETVDYPLMVHLKKLIAENNFDADLLYLFAPAMEADLEVTPRGNGIQNNILSALKNYRSSTQIIDGDIILGDFSEFMIAQWGDGMTIQVNPYSNDDEGKIKITAKMHVDMGIKNPGAFSLAKKKATAK
ncbi:phage major capsid protein [Francisella philomiragia]|uniref:phage major capsid protein n=1 Tax=Francisella philomiragia TaxID=28110 RepID=UPI00224330E0|nr:phage major capsid protein [Francisella philomiragia]